MTYPIPIGDILEMIGSDGLVFGRLVHLGDGICTAERFAPERGPTGGLTNSGKGTWINGAKTGPLTEVQLAEWRKRKSI